MSRTIRKPLRMIEENEETYVKHQLNSRFRRWNKSYRYESKTVRRKKPQEQYEAECEAADAEYNELLKKASYDEYGHPYVGKTFDSRWECGKMVYKYYPNYIRVRYVTRYHRIDIPWSIEQETEELKKQYREFSRDGHWNETSRNSGFKHACDKEFRNKTRCMIGKIMHNKVDPDDVVFPDRKDGKHKIWDFW